MNLFYKGSLLLAVSFAFYGSLVLLCGGCSSSSEPLPDKSEIGAAGKTEMMPPLPPEGKKTNDRIAPPPPPGGRTPGDRIVPPPPPGEDAIDDRLPPPLEEQNAGNEVGALEEMEL